MTITEDAYWAAWMTQSATHFCGPSSSAMDLGSTHTLNGAPGAYREGSGSVIGVVR